MMTNQDILRIAMMQSAEDIGTLGSDLVKSRRPVRSIPVP